MSIFVVRNIKVLHPLGLMLVAVAGTAQSAPPVKPAAIEAVELCTQVTRPDSFVLEPLAAAGWTEGEIKDIDKAPGGAAANRLFIREGAGAVIMLNIKEGKDKGGYYCHVITNGPAKFVDLFERALQPTLGPALKFGPNITFFKSDKKPYIVSLSRKPAGKDVMADVMVMAFVPKEKSE